MSAASPAPGVFTIGELADRTRVSPRLLRYYESRGLITASRTPRGHRRYAEGTELIVRQIRRLLAAGLPTSVISELLDCITDDDRLVPCAVPLLVDHIRDYDERIAELHSTRESLQELITAATRQP